MDRRDLQDMKACVEDGQWLKRCAGDRLIIKNICCIHCGSMDPESLCAKPRREAKKQVT